MAEQKAKSNSVITTRRDGMVLIFAVKGVGELLFDTTKASAECRAQAEWHGWTQRVSDAAALSRDTKTGLAATPQSKFDAMRKLVEHYETGTSEWRMAGGGGGGIGAEKAMLVRALGVIYPQKSQEDLAGWVGKRSAGERAALMESEKIKPLVEKFRAEQASGADAEGLLSELGEAGGEEAGGEAESEGT